MASEAESAHVLRTLRALELLAAGPRTENELAEGLDVHARTVRRLLGRLVEVGYVSEVPDRPLRYAATLKIVALAGMVLERTDLVQLARPYVAALRDASGESAYLTVPVEGGAMHVLREDSENVISARPRLSEVVPSHVTAVGKVLIAYGAAAVPSEPLDSFTEFTTVELADLQRQLSEIRERGYAVDDREHDRDQRCVAAPVFDHNGAAVAAIGISAPAFRLTPAEVPATGELVAEHAARLSAALGLPRHGGASEADAAAALP